MTFSESCVSRRELSREAALHAPRDDDDSEATGRSEPRIFSTSRAPVVLGRALSVRDREASRDRRAPPRFPSSRARVLITFLLSFFLSRAEADHVSFLWTPADQSWVENGALRCGRDASN